MKIRCRAMGNAGVFLENGGGRVYIDSFFQGVEHVGGSPLLTGKKAEKADLIIVTHPHFDHVDPVQVGDALAASGAVLAGPEKVVELFSGKLPAERLMPLEPAERARPPASASGEAAGIRVTAFRTYHCRGHNSCLVEMGGARIFHDGDNERTQHFRIEELAPIDLLLLCPWQGSEAGRFVNRLSPRGWLLVHLTDEEIAEHRKGKFLPGLVEPIPEVMAASLYPGESLEL